MKTRTATALSIVGVLAAGTAAALANTHVLTSRAASNSTPDILSVNTTSIPVPIQAANPDATTGDLSATQSPTIADTSITSYAIGDAGIVKLRVNSDNVEVVEVVPNSGWKTIDAASSAGTYPAAVVLASADTEVTFAAAFVDGRVVTDVESRSLVPPPGGSPQKDDQHRDDEHDDDDHDRDHRDDGHEEHDDDDD